MKALVFDLETTGIPNKTENNLYFPYKLLSYYKRSRIVSICMMLYDTNQKKIQKVLAQIVKPSYDKSFYSEAEKIHKISYEQAEKEGVEFKHLCADIESLINECDVIVSHNIGFDYSILLSELYRANHDLGPLINSKRLYCTMLAGASKVKGADTIKLPELYKALTNKDMEERHESKYDTIHCLVCFDKLLNESAEYFELGYYN